MNPPGGASLAISPPDRAIVTATAVLGSAGIAIAVITDGNLGAMLAPLLVVAVVAVGWTVPLRWSVLALLFLGVTLEAPYEAFAGYQFRTPWSAAGTALLGNLNLLLPVRALKMSGFDLVVVYLFAVHATRRARQSSIDGDGFVPLPQATLVGAAVTAAGILFFWAWGIARGGDFSNSLWQLQKPLYGPLLLLLLHAAFRGSRDLPALGTALVAAAVYRGALATWIHFTVRDIGGEPLPYATTHADTVLFAAAVALIVIVRNERVRLRSPGLAAGALAVILCGLVFNGRRLAWVSVAGALLIIVLMSPWTRFKRRIARAAVFLAPVAMVYLAAGWNSNSSVFAPAAVVRSLVDSKTDASSLWRDIENWNLIRNVADHPFIGLGFGHQYVEYMPVADVSSMYPQYRYIPHNSAVALFVFAGAGGVAAIWALLVATVYLAARAYRKATDPGERAGAVMCVIIVFLYLNQNYGDIGVSSWISPLFLATAAMVAGKLAVATGAWPWPYRRRPIVVGSR